MACPYRDPGIMNDSPVTRVDFNQDARWREPALSQFALAFRSFGHCACATAE